MGEIAYRNHKMAKITSHCNYTGVLKDILQKLETASIELLQIESRVNNKRKNGEETIDFWISYVEPNDPVQYDMLVRELNKMSVNISEVAAPRVNGFPVCFDDIDNMDVIKLESEIKDHSDPMYTDMEYRERRKF